MSHLYNDPMVRQRRRDLRKNQTNAEVVVWGLLRNKQMCGLRFFRQYSVGPYVLDFYCPSRRLAIEIDGGQHNALDTIEQDTRRTDYLSEHGIQVIRFWNNEVLTNYEGVWERIKECVTPSISPLS